MIPEQHTGLREGVASGMSNGFGRRGRPPAGQGLREALRWMSACGRHDAAAVEEACRRFDLSPLEEEFLLKEARRIAGQQAQPPREGES
jgi:hypothetical protein